MKKINFEDGVLVTPGKVKVNNVDYNVVPAAYTGNTPLSANVLNLLQSNIENAISIKESRLLTTVVIAQNTDYAIPFNYTVGANILDVYYQNCKLILNENFIEVGVNGSVSNKIQFKDWIVPVGKNLEFKVRGDIV